MMFKNRLTFALSAILMLSLSSCATLLMDGSKRQSVVITSNIEGAKVYNSKNQLIGTTPLVYKPQKGGINQLFNIEKEGYEPATVSISYSENVAFAALDAMLFCIPCIVDYPTGNIYSLDVDTVTGLLRRKMDKNAARIPFVFEGVEWDIKEGIIIGKDLNDEIYFKKSALESYLYKEQITKASFSSYYEILNGTRNDKFSYIKRSSTIELKAFVHKLSSNLIKRKGAYIRICEADIEWVISQNQGRKEIKRIRSTSREEVQYDETKQVLAMMITASAIKLFNDADLYDLLLQESKNTEFEEEVQGNVVQIAKVTTPTFSKSKDMFRHLMKSVVTIEHGGGHGSGFFISEDGYLITNYHVIKGEKTVNVQLGESITLSADIIKSDEAYDIALLKVVGKGFSPLELIVSDSVSPGEDVFAIGTPEDVSLGQSVTKGVLSGKRKFEDKIYIQTDVAINAGNSGGPLLNEEGKVVGMVTSKLIGRGIEGIGFCVPSETILKVINITYK